MENRSRLIAMICLAGLLAGCGSLPMPSGTIAGHDATRAVITLPREQTVTLRDGRGFTLPAGDYKGIMDDEDGIYFHAPRMITLHETFFGRALDPKLRDGGIYLRREETHRPSIYFQMDIDEGSELQRLRSSRPYVFDLKKGEHVVFTLTSAPRRRRPPRRYIHLPAPHDSFVAPLVQNSPSKSLLTDGVFLFG